MYMSPGDYQILTSMLIFYVVLFAILGIVGLAGYLFKGFGMFKIAKRMGIGHAWLAFIPIASNYLQGELAGEIQLGGKKSVKNMGLWTLLVPILYNVLIGIFVFAMVFSIMLPAISGAAAGASEAAMASAMLGSMFSWIGIFMLVAIAGQALLYLIFGLARYQTHIRFTTPAMAVLHMILGIFIPLYQPIYYFVLRNKPFIGEAAPQQIAAEPQQ